MHLLYLHYSLSVPLLTLPLPLSCSPSSSLQEVRFSASIDFKLPLRKACAEDLEKLCKGRWPGDMGRLLKWEWDMASLPGERILHQAVCLFAEAYPRHPVFDHTSCVRSLCAPRCRAHTVCT